MMRLLGVQLDRSTCPFTITILRQWPICGMSGDLLVLELRSWQSILLGICIAHGYRHGNSLFTLRDLTCEDVQSCFPPVLLHFRICLVGPLVFVGGHAAGHGAEIGHQVPGCQRTDSSCHFQGTPSCLRRELHGPYSGASLVGQVLRRQRAHPNRRHGASWPSQRTQQVDHPDSAASPTGLPPHHLTAQQAHWCRVWNSAKNFEVRLEND